MRRQYLRQWFTFPIGWLLICLILWRLVDRDRGAPLQSLFALWPLFAGVPFWLIYFPLMYRSKLRRNIDGMVREGSSRTIFTRHRVTITPESIAEDTALSQSSTSWAGIERIVMSNDYAFFYKSALSAVIVPKRAFPTAAQFDEFIAKAKSFHGKEPAPTR